MRKINKSSFIFSTSEEEFRQIVLSSKSVNEIGTKLGFKYKPGKYSKNQIKSRILSLGMKIPVGTTARKTFPKKDPKVLKERKCSECGKSLWRKTKTGMCHTCFVKDRYEIDLSLWRQNKLIIKSDDIPESIRKYMFLKHSSKCQKCGWSSVNSFTKKIPLQVHHIDGNHRNNLEENLELLCPNCHSLTETFGSRNRGKGRDARRSWRKKQKTD